MAIVYDEPAPKSRIAYDEAPTRAPVKSAALLAAEKNNSLPPLPGSPEEAAQRANSKPIDSAGESGLDQVKRIIGSVAGPALKGLAAAGEMGLSGATGLAASGVNLANAATGATHFAKQPGESDADFYKRTREQVTYTPRTEGGKELASSAIPAAIGNTIGQSGKAFGELTGSPTAGELIKDAATVGTAAIPALRTDGAAEVAAPKVTISENPVAAARALKYKVRPSDVANTEPETSVKTTTEAERLAGSDELRKSLMSFNQKQSTAHGLADVGLPETEPRITPRLLDQARAAPLATYRNAGRAINNFDANAPDFHADLATVANREGLHPDTRADIAKAVSEYKGRDMSGPDAIKSISVLRRAASRAAKSDDPSMQDFGFAQRQIADAIEAQVSRQLEITGNTQLMEEFPAARQQLAKVNDVDTATRAGQLDIHVLKKLKERGAPLSGRLSAMADMAEMFPHITKHPQTISNVSGGGAVPGVGPVLDLASAGIRPITRQFLKSDFYQNQLGKPAAELGPNSPLSDYFSPPPAPKGGGAPPFAPEPPPGLPKTPASAMLEAHRRAGDLSLADEVSNPDRLPEAPSRLTAETPPATPRGLPFKSGQPSGVSRAGNLELAPDETTGRLPGGQSPRAAGMAQNVPGTSLFNELRAVRGRPDEVAGELSLAPEGPTSGGTGSSGPTITPNPKHPGFFDVKTAGEKSGVTVQGRANAESLVKSLGEEFGSSTPAPTRRSSDRLRGNGQLPRNAFDELFGKRADDVKHAVDETGSHTFTTKNGEATAQEGNGYLLMKRSDVAESARGNGEGKALVKAGIDKARELGLKYGSDISVSPAQERVYASLRKEGITVKQNSAERSKVTGNLVSKDPRKPVFEVETAPEVGKKAVGE